MSRVRPFDLPVLETITPDTAIVADNGELVGRTTPTNLADFAAPVASREDAEQGLDNSKRMTALRTHQAIEATAGTASYPKMSDGASVQEAIAVAATPADLLASTAQYTVGSTIRTADGFIYEVAPADASDAHLTTAGGVKLYVVGPYDIRAFGAVGDDAADDTAAIQAALDRTGDVYLPKGTYRVTAPLEGRSNTRFYGPGRLKAYHSGRMIDALSLESFQVEGITLDANNMADCGAMVVGCHQPTFLGVKVLRTKDSGENFRGGILFSLCTDPLLDNARFEDISTENVQTRAMAFTTCTGAKASRLWARNVAKFLSLSNTTDFSFSDCEGYNILDNGVYLNNACMRGTFNNIEFYTVGEGWVVDLSDDEGNSLAKAQITVSNFVVRNASNRAITLRLGQDVVFSTGTIVGGSSGIAQSASFAGCQNIQFANINISNTTGRPISLVNDCRNIYFHGLNIMGGGDARAVVVAQSCNSVYFFNPVIMKGSGDTQIAISYSGGAVSERSGGVFNLVTDANSGVETPTDGTGAGINVFGPDFILNKSLTIRTHSGNDEVATVQVGTRNSSVGAGEIVGQYTMYTSDTSGAGQREFFKLFARSLTSAGSTYEVRAQVDEAEGIILNANGATVKLPTSAAGLPSGCLWNNAGTIAITP